MAELMALAAATKALPRDWGKQAVQRMFASRLSELRGVPHKIAQILSASSHEDLAEIHTQAILELEPLDGAVLLKSIEQDLARVPVELLEFDPVGIPASLGQVHRVTMADGREMALKIQYPQIKEMMKLDQSLMGLVTGSFDAFKEGFHLEEYRKIIERELAGEMNYELELSQQQKMFDLFVDHPHIVIPKPWAEGCSSRHLLMSYEASQPWQVWLKTANEQEKRKAADVLSEFHLRCMFTGAFVHADPNPGNFGIRGRGENFQWVIYDYGSIWNLEPGHNLLWLKLLQWVDREEPDLLAWLVSMGFAEASLEALQSRLLPFLHMLFEPLLCQGRYPLQEWNRKNRARDLLGEHRWSFMVAAPAFILPVMRAWMGLFQMSEKIGVGLFARKHIEKAWNQYARELAVLQPVSCQAQSVVSGMAKGLNVKVIRDGITKVSVTLPRQGLEDLTAVMGEEICQKVRNEGVDLDELVRQARDNGYRPMELFQFSDEKRSIIVSLV